MSYNLDLICHHEECLDLVGQDFETTGIQI